MNGDFDSKKDCRICYYITCYEPIDDYLTIVLSIQYDDYLYNINAGKYQIQISDAFGADCFEQFNSFEEGLAKLEQYIGQKPEIFKITD